jgi:hypothetical protein
MPLNVVTSKVIYYVFQDPPEASCTWCTVCELSSHNKRPSAEDPVAT